MGGSEPQKRHSRQLTVGWLRRVVHGASDNDAPIIQPSKEDINMNPRMITDPDHEVINMVNASTNKRRRVAEQREILRRMK